MEKKNPVKIIINAKAFDPEKERAFVKTLADLCDKVAKDFGLEYTDDEELKIVDDDEVEELIPGEPEKDPEDPLADLERRAVDALRSTIRERYADKRKFQKTVGTNFAKVDALVAVYAALNFVDRCPVSRAALLPAVLEYARAAFVYDEFIQTKDAIKKRGAFAVLLNAQARAANRVASVLNIDEDDRKTELLMILYKSKKKLAELLN